MTVRLKGRFRLGLLAVPRGAAGLTHQVFFSTNGKRPELVATDGKMMAVIPVDTVGKGPAQTARVDGEAFGRATQGMKPSEERQLQIKDGHILVRDDQGREMMSVPAGDPSEKGLPANYRQAIPAVGSQQFALAIDPRAVVRMARVLGATEKLVLHGDASPKHGVVHKPLRVTPEAWGGDDKPHGVMMPEVIEEDRRGRKLVLETTVSK